MVCDKTKLVGLLFKKESNVSVIESSDSNFGGKGRASGKQFCPGGKKVG